MCVCACACACVCMYICEVVKFGYRELGMCGVRSQNRRRRLLVGLMLSVFNAD